LYMMDETNCRVSEVNKNNVGSTTSSNRPNPRNSNINDQSIPQLEERIKTNIYRNTTSDPSTSYLPPDSLEYDSADEKVDAKMNAKESAAVTAAAQPNEMKAVEDTDQCAWRVGVSISDGFASADSNVQGVVGDAAAAEVTNRNGEDRGTCLGMLVKEHSVLSSPSPTSLPSSTESHHDLKRDPYQSLHEPVLFDDQAAQRVEPALAASCEALGFDIAEMWLRTGGRSHQLIASYLRPTALDETQRNDLTELYYGVDASSRTHRFSPALCKKAKDVRHVIWVPDDTEHGAQALSCSLSNVKTAVAVPVTHQKTNTNFTIIYFSLSKTNKTPTAIEFLMHMSLATAITAVNILHQDLKRVPSHVSNLALGLPFRLQDDAQAVDHLSQSEHHFSIPDQFNPQTPLHAPPNPNTEPLFPHTIVTTSSSPTMAQLDYNIKYELLRNREYLTDGTNNWIHTAVMNKQPVVVKELKPECEDDIRAINEIEEELAIHSKLCHDNVCAVRGAGTSSKGTRFIVLERLDGGTLGQVFGYKARIRDRRKRFARRKKKMSTMEALRCALAISEAMDYCHQRAIPGCMVIHRDLKPDNIGFALDGTVKVIDFGLATIVENATPGSDQVYNLSGETGSLRYMAPEVADARPYNHKVDVYSFGMIVWELLSYEKPFEGLDRQQFYERVVHGGERPPLSRKLPVKWSQLITQCWSADAEQRPDFSSIAETLKEMVVCEQNKAPKSLFSSLFTERASNKGSRGDKKLTERHSTWF